MLGKPSMSRGSQVSQVDPIPGLFLGQRGPHGLGAPGLVRGGLGDGALGLPAQWRRPALMAARAPASRV